MSWIKEFFISGKTSFGISPIACPNCHELIKLGDEIFSFGYYRHKKCHEMSLETRKLLGVDKLIEEEERGGD